MRDDGPRPGPARRRIRVGLIGTGIGESKSPALHEREGAAQGLDYSYELFDLADRGAGIAALPGLLREAEASGFAGVNVTHRCKQAVIPLLSDLSEDARLVGAVNTVVFRDGRRIGHNTDWTGFREGFRRGLPDAKLGRAVLLGAGGAGVAVAHAALELGIARLSIVDREPGRAAALAAALNARFPGDPAEAPADLAAALAASDGLIHATPTGMAGHPGLPLDPDTLAARHWVAEIVYFPLETELLRLARRKGCRVVDGGGMAVFQAVGAFALFSGVAPDAERMARHFREMIAGASPPAAALEFRSAGDGLG
jgi:shikimate dehydrogenase